MKILSSKQLYEADKITCKKQNITSIDLMERAAGYIFNWLHQRLQGAPVPIHIFCGIGNNGGDGLALGRMLVENGYTVKIYVANFTDKRSKCFLINYDRFKNVSKKWPLLMTSEEDFPVIDTQDIIIDALFGIGINRPIKGWVKKLVQHINATNAFKLSIDIPSGLSADDPLMDAEAVVKSNHTLTFQTPKLSFFLPETGPFVTYYEALNIGLDPEFIQNAPSFADVISKNEAQQLYRQRTKYAHKGNFGHVLIAAGSYGSIGAAILSSKACMRIGAGKTTAFIPECGYTAMQTAAPEVMVLTDIDKKILTNIEYSFEPQAIAVGMGIGTNLTTKKAIEALFIKATCPVLIDADAINCIAAHSDLLQVLPENAVFTPHPGELEKLIGVWDNDYDKLEKTKAFSKKHKAVVVIKGANTMVVSNDELYINTTGNPGMATAGSGDVLSGVIAGLMAQGYDPLMAAVFGVYLHGSAGNIASQVIGFEAMIASDLIDTLGDAFIELFRKETTADASK